MKELTAKEAAKLCGKTPQQFFYLRKVGKLPYKFREVGTGKNKRYILEDEQENLDGVPLSRVEKLRAEKLSLEAKKIKQSLYEDRMSLVEKAIDVYQEKVSIPLMAKLRGIIQKWDISEREKEEWNRAVTDGLTEGLRRSKADIKELVLR